MKGAISSGMAAIVVLLVGLSVGVLVYAGSTMLAVTPRAAVTYDGEFDDGALPTDGSFVNDFSEYIDCNITDDYLGGSDYTSCVYRTQVTPGNASNSTSVYFALMLDIDNPVQDMEIQGDLQSTGTCKPNDDMTVKNVEVWTHEDNPRLVASINTPDTDEIDGNTGPLMGGEYVFTVEIRYGGIQPDCVAGDDILKLQFDLTTSGDADAARVLLESK